MFLRFEIKCCFILLIRKELSKIFGHRYSFIVMQGKDKTAEERRIAICIFDDVAEQCREASLKYLILHSNFVLLKYFVTVKFCGFLF